MKRSLWIWAAALCFLCGSVVRADYLEVRRAAIIRAEPDREAAVLERVTRGMCLELLDDGRQSEGYYDVRTVSLGQPGWVYRTFVRRHRGQIPAPEPEEEPADPLADSTDRLTPEQRRDAARHLRLGKPQAIYERAREGYVLAQDARLKIPLWVQYELRPEDLEGHAERTEDFRPDTSIPFGSRAELEDYEGSGYDRGHMAPAGDMTRSWDTMSESFLLSNMSPQVGVGFNRQVWKNLEAAVRGWVQQRGTLTVITGPVFAVDGDHVTYEVIGQGHVAVPTHFFKIVVDVDGPSGIEALAFLLPNETLSGRHYSEFLTSIDEIEQATGLDFLSTVSAALQNEVESHKAANVW